jgi:hypothetical protein
MTAAYRSGRMGADPATFWYKGELGFFDNYIIPLAKKLKECNVFGVSSDECLNYATQNRAEWESRGEEVCEMMFEKIRHIEAANEEQALETSTETSTDSNSSMQSQPNSQAPATLHQKITQRIAPNSSRLLEL